MRRLRQLYRRFFQKMVFRSLRILLKNRRSKEPFLPGKFRTTHRGRVGKYHTYVIYASPQRDIPENAVDQPVRTLVKQSEDRFLAGRFFAPIAGQMDAQTAVITARLQQGDEDNPADHIMTIMPDVH